MTRTSAARAVHANDATTAQTAVNRVMARRSSLWQRPSIFCERFFKMFEFIGFRFGPAGCKWQSSIQTRIACVPILERQPSTLVNAFPDYKECAIYGSAFIAFPETIRMQHTWQIHLQTASYRVIRRFPD
jgi:hypothetical protein